MRTRSFTLSIISILWAFSLLFPSASYGDKKEEKDKKAGCIAGTNCMLIIDMSANPGDVAIVTNFAFVAPGSKSDTAIDNGIGFNTVNIDSFHVLSREILAPPAANALKLTVGKASTDVIDNLFATKGQQKFFANGHHLFNLDRLRAAADWMAQPGNLKPDASVPAGTYGTISFQQFLDNVQNTRTMYGLVRVRIPLELGGCVNTNGNCDRNALGSLVPRSNLYGFCQSSTGLCSCAPDNGFKIQEGRTLCGLSMPNSAQIRVKGSLLWDFVASADSATLKAGDPVPLELLPWAPRELYFKVEVPIMVNWAFDADADGAMDNMFNIAQVTRGGVDGILTAPPITWAMVAPTNKAAFEYHTGQVLTETLFDTLDNATKYHLMMPSGYPTGWAEAFDKLNITGSVWKSIPAQPAFGLPDGYDRSILTANVVRDPDFEDIPAYLYSGGLIDMHDHVNISGLVYVPQGLELEAKDSKLPTRQYISGAVVVRDTFFIEAKTNTITVISSNPTSYSTAVVNSAIITTPGGGGLVRSAAFAFGGSVGGNTFSQKPAANTGPVITGDNLCFFGCTLKSLADIGSTPNPGANRWIEVRPQVPVPAVSSQVLP